MNGCLFTFRQKLTFDVRVEHKEKKRNTQNMTNVLLATETERKRDEKNEDEKELCSILSLS